MPWRRGQAYAQDLRDRVLASPGLLREVAAAALQRAADAWPGLSRLVQVVRQRQAKGKPLSQETSYYLSSLPAHTGAHVLAHSIRAHWMRGKPVALEPGRGQARVLQRPGTAQPKPAAAHSAATAQERYLREGGCAGQAQTRRLGSGLSGAHSGYLNLDAIALPRSSRRYIPNSPCPEIRGQDHSCQCRWHPRGPAHPAGRR